MPMCGRESARQITETWLTPPGIINSVGTFDMDPCCPPNMPWRTAAVMLTEKEDGLATAWVGRVWLNPPWGRAATPWMTKMARHGNGIALLPARTETKMFHEFVWAKADAICFVRGRPVFFDANGKPGNGNCGAPICLVAYGKLNAHALRTCGLGPMVQWIKTEAK
jgi:hypothetical protein